MVRNSPEPSQWFSFKLESASLDEGVDAQALAELIEQITTATVTIAREGLGLRHRAGPWSAEERALGALRITGLRSGSVELSFAPPAPVVGRQTALEFAEITPDDVISEFMFQLGSIRHGEEVTDRRLRSRLAVESVLQAATRIAPTVSASFTPEKGEPLSQIVLLGELPRARAAVERTSRNRVFFARVHMADLDPEHPRLRAQLPDGTNLVLDVHPDAVASLRGSLDQVVEIHVTEDLVGGDVVQRLVGSVRLLEAPELGPDRPERTILELAREQGLRGPPPNYRILLSKVFVDDDEAERFREYSEGLRAVDR